MTPSAASPPAASPLAALAEPLAVVCHDAGAANIVLAWLRARGLAGVRAVMEGPARRLWDATFPGVTPVPSLEAALAGAAVLVSGTGWASDLEHAARRRARDTGVRSIAVIDHWVNYPDRFRRGGETVLPDEFWVTDDEARAEAERHFDPAAIRQMPNGYLAEQIARVAPVDPAAPPVLLYVLEPMRSDWGRGRPGEFQALDYFWEALPALGLPPDVALRLRPHPSEAADKYAAWVAERTTRQERPVGFDRSPDVSAALGGVRWVAGCESFALVLALHAGRTVFCTLPPWAPACRLPHAGLIHVRSLPGAPAPRPATSG